MTPALPLQKQIKAALMSTDGYSFSLTPTEKNARQGPLCSIAAPLPL